MASTFHFLINKQVSSEKARDLPKITYLRRGDANTLMAESEEELKSLLMKVKGE